MKKIIILAMLLIVSIASFSQQTTNLAPVFQGYGIVDISYPALSVKINLH